MIRILIVDDSQIKVEKIKAAINDVQVAVDCSFCETTSEAALQLLNKSFDLIILDMLIPRRIGEKPKPDGGILFLKDLNRNNKLNKPDAIIGLTEFTDVQKQFSKAFNIEGWVLCEYDHTSTEWEETIKNKIYYLLNKKENQKMVIENTILIFSAIGKEMIELRNHLSNLKPIRHEVTGTIYEKGEYGNYNVVLMETGMGNIVSGIEVDRALMKFNPQYSFFVGIGGGIKDVNIGDVVFGSKIYALESGKDDEEFYARPNFGETDYRLQQLAKFMCRDKILSAELNNQVQNHNKFSDSVRLFCAPITSLEKVVSSKQSISYERIKKHANDSIAIAMEEYGFLEACKAHNVMAMVIRGISDLIDKKTESDSSGSQEFASLCAGISVYKMIDGLV